MLLHMAVTVALKGRSSCCCVTAPGLWRGTLEIQGSSPFLLPLLPPPLFRSSISPHLTSLSPFFFSFSAALTHQHQQAEDNARTHTNTHTHTRQLCTLTWTASFSVCGLKYKRLVCLIFACCLHARVYVDTHKHV